MSKIENIIAALQEQDENAAQKFDKYFNFEVDSIDEIVDMLEHDSDMLDEVAQYLGIEG